MYDKNSLNYFLTALRHTLYDNFSNYALNKPICHTVFHSLVR